MKDILLKPNEYDMYDIDFSFGDFELTTGLDTAITTSLLVDKRADASEIRSPQERRGNIIDELSDENDFEIGSKLWLLGQSRSTPETVSLAEAYASECLQWLIDDGLAESVVVAGFISNNNINLEITVNESDGTTFNNVYQLWKNTKIA